MIPENLASFLSDHYASFSARRALWIWAQGEPRDVDFTPAPDIAWPAMLSRITEKSPITVHGLVRQMLFDHPGHMSLLALADELAKMDQPDYQAIAEIVHHMLENQAPGFHFDLLTALLQGLAGVSGDTLFVTLCSRLNGCWDHEGRDFLEESLTAISEGALGPSGPALVTIIQQLVDALPKLTEISTHADFDRIQNDMQTVTQPLAEADSPVLSGSQIAAMEPFIDLITDASHDAHNTTDETLLAAVAMLTHLWNTLKQMAGSDSLENSVPPLSAAGALQEVLWATTAASS